MSIDPFSEFLAPVSDRTAVDRIKETLSLLPIQRPFWKQLVEARPPVGPEMLVAMEQAHIFLFAWDFLSAFRGEDSFGGQFSFPYDNIIFELHLARKDRPALRVAAWFHHHEDGYPVCWLFCREQVAAVGWNFVGLYRNRDQKWQCATKNDPRAFAFAWALFEFAFEQIAAAMVVLNAGVAQSYNQAAPAKLQRSRQRSGKAPLPTYSVIDLPKKSTSSNATGDGSGVRAHWRRRHPHSYWIAGELVQKTIGPFRVGDETLGTVDQVYRLIPPENDR